MSAAPAQQLQYEVSFEPPDVLVFGSWGDVSLEQMRKVVDLIRERGERGGVMVLADVTRTTGMSAEARAYVGKQFQPEWVLSTAIVGASFPMKVAVKAMALASSLFGKATYELVFVDSLDEGRAVLAQHRARRAAAKG
jgi:hypothetical protein